MPHHSRDSKTAPPEFPQIRISPWHSISCPRGCPCWPILGLNPLTPKVRHPCPGSWQLVDRAAVLPAERDTSIPKVTEITQRNSLVRNFKCKQLQSTTDSSEAGSASEVSVVDVPKLSWTKTLRAPAPAACSLEISNTVLRGPAGILEKVWKKQLPEHSQDHSRPCAWWST